MNPVAALPHLPRNGWERLKGREPVVLAMAATWVVAIALDAVTTCVMMQTGDYAEANPVAAWVIDLVGLYPAVTLLSAWTAAIALVSLARGTDAATRTCVWGTRAIMIAKLAVGISNVLLAATGIDLL